VDVVAAPDRDRPPLAAMKIAEEESVARLLFRRGQQLRAPPHCSTNYRDYGPVVAEVLLDPAEAAEEGIVVTSLRGKRNASLKSTVLLLRRMRVKRDRSVLECAASSSQGGRIDEEETHFVKKR
jgi:hypothetical protein